MPILQKFPVSSMLGSPFADYLNVTTPADNGDAVRSALVPLLESVSIVEETEDALRLYALDGARLIPSGVFKFSKRGKVAVVSASGSALAALRVKDVLPEYVSLLSDFPHRVSMLHCTQDYHLSCPSAAVLSVKAAAVAGDLSLTRKRILPEHVRSLLQVNAEGLETGTIYLGNRANADVWAKVYDKRQERLSRGFSDPGPIVRVEVAVQSDVGATLRDALNPADLFFHFAGRSLVDTPAKVCPWIAHGDGFVLPRREDRTAVERMENILAFSYDIDRLIKVAREAYGDKSGAVLGRAMAKRCTGFLEAAA
jgi:hypothetical protein